MAGNDICGTLTLDKAVLICSRNELLSVFPRMAIEVVRLCQCPSVQRRELEAAILRDPGLTARVIQIANSSLYGSCGATSISRAFNVMGLNGVRSAVTRFVIQQVSARHASASNFDHMSLWTHSMAVATTARMLALMKGEGQAEELYVVGMLHEFGLLVLDRLAPDRLTQAIICAKDSDQPLAFGVQVVFGFDHHELAAQVLKNWKFTPLCYESIRYIANPMDAGDHASTAQTLASASAIACIAGMPNHSCNLPACEEILAQQGFAQANLDDLMKRLNQDVSYAMAHFGLAA